ncbi:MAG: hypothetical protein JWO65_863 [Sphingomonas bacterium]|jgi:preprotein translocase subunit YajC|nr:hypothetical protein [Sphingomonas bacterium]
MNTKAFAILSSTAALLAIPAMASAQTAPAGGAPAAASAAVPAPVALAQGTTVYDSAGGTVGTIESVEGDFAVLATGKSKVRLPKSSFGAGTKGPMIGMTAAQVDQAAAQAAPQATAAQAAPAKANVVKGAAVADTQGGSVGTIADVDAQFATVTLTTGGKVRLPVTAFGAGSNGGLRIAMTAAQLSAAAGAAKGG